MNLNGISLPAELFGILLVIALAVGIHIHLDRRRIIAQAARREAQQAALLAAVPDAVLRIENKNQVYILNPQAEKLLGKTGVISFAELLEFIPDLQLEQDHGRKRLRARQADGSTLPLDLAWSAYDFSDGRDRGGKNVLLVVRDISLREQIEMRLRERDAALARAARVATAGELASALAHELNQPMTALISYLRAARLIEQAEPRADMRLGNTLGKAADEALRAADILRKLRDFYIGRGPKLESIDLLELIDSSVDEFRGRHKQIAVELRYDTERPLAPVQADRMYVEIILSNLLNNAAEALQGCDSAKIRVEATSEQGVIAISVDDNGPGISGDQTTIFKPFYTSKSEGMGLGLAMSRSLAESLGGTLRNALSRLGGARFELRLPLSMDCASVRKET
jgi:two-component system, LuxR family, sensor kinase FixL